MKKKVFIVGANITLACLIILAAAWGWANIVSMKPRHLMSVWEITGEVEEEKEWERALEKLQTARALNSFDTDYVFDIGRLYEWKALGHPTWSDEAKANRVKAIEQYRLAASMRPSWGVPWVQLAQNKAMKQEMGESAFNALQKAMILEPWEPYTLRKTIWIGLATWDQMQVSQKEGFLKHIQHASRWQLRFVLHAAIQFGWESNLRPLLENDPARERLERELKRRKNGV